MFKQVKEQNIFTFSFPISTKNLLCSKMSVLLLYLRPDLTLSKDTASYIQLYVIGDITEN